MLTPNERNKEDKFGAHPRPCCGLHGRHLLEVLLDNALVQRRLRLAQRRKRVRHNLGIGEAGTKTGVCTYCLNLDFNALILKSFVAAPFRSDLESERRNTSADLLAAVDKKGHFIKETLRSTAAKPERKHLRVI